MMGRKGEARRAWLLFSALTPVCLPAAALVGAAAPHRFSNDLLAIAIVIVWLTAGHRLLFGRRTDRIPVLNYHSVTPAGAWLGLDGRLSVSPGLFHRNMKYLRDADYTTVTMSECVSLLAQEIPWPEGKRIAAVTFDDGYRDNLIYALPVLKEYRVRATIFISTAFVRQAPGQKDTGTAAIEEAGYLTVEGIAATKKSGLVEFQSHAHSHDREFSSDRPVGFYHESAENRWLLWRLFPETRTNWWRTSQRPPPGYPVFKQSPALVVRRFIPERKYIGHLCACGEKVKDKPFPVFIREMNKADADWQGSRGRFESDESCRQRVEKDLAESRRNLREILGEEVDILCWPENEYTAEGLEAAGRVGFRATVSNRFRVVNKSVEGATMIGRTFVGPRYFGIAHDGLDHLGFRINLMMCEGIYWVYPLSLLAAVVRFLVETLSRAIPNVGKSVVYDRPFRTC